MTGRFRLHPSRGDPVVHHGSRNPVFNQGHALPRQSFKVKGHASLLRVESIVFDRDVLSEDPLAELARHEGARLGKSQAPESEPRHELQ